MSDKENELLECDALPVDELRIVNCDASQVANISNSVTNNNMLVSAQSNTAANFTFEGCNGVTIGNVMTLFNPGWSPGSSSSSAVARTNQDVADESIYKRTPTINEMMRSEQPLNDKYLDIFCQNFGEKWQAVPVLLGINDLFVERMREDYFNNHGTGEVIFQILHNFFQNHQDIATVGWFTRFLWKNGYRKTIHTVKERYKQLKELDELDET